MQHQIAALDVLDFLKNERYQTNNELVNKLLLVNNLWKGALHKEAYLLQYEVKVVVEQSQFELGLGRSL